MVRDWALLGMGATTCVLRQDAPIFDHSSSEAAGEYTAVGCSNGEIFGVGSLEGNMMVVMDSGGDVAR
jgi:hypothetical protein